MPGSLMTADTSFPDLKGKESTEEKFETITGYLYLLLEQLRYTLSNLGEENFNGAELDHLGRVFTGPLTVRVEETEQGVTQLSVTVEGVKSTVKGLDGRFSSVEQSVNGVVSRVNGLDNRFSSVDQDVDGLNIRTIGGTTCITGDHVKTGRIVSQNGMSEINLNTGMASLSGSYRVVDPNGGAEIGGVKYDSSGAGTSSEAKNRMWVYTNGNWALKVQAGGNLSLEGSSLVHIRGPQEVTVSVGETRWTFGKYGIYYNDTLAVSPLAT